MTFIKNKTALFSFLLIFILSGCANNDKGNADTTSQYVMEHTDIDNAEETITGRIRSVSGIMDDYFEETVTESKMDIRDILDREEEFLTFDGWDVRIIYVYLLSDKGYEKYMFPINYSEQGKIIIHLPDDITQMYVLCPEYTNVEAMTKADSSVAAEQGLYVVDGGDKSGTVGGDLRYRIFDVDIFVEENISFKLCDAIESDDYEIYGGFELQVE